MDCNFEFSIVRCLGSFQSFDTKNNVGTESYYTVIFAVTGTYLKDKFVCVNLLEQKYVFKFE